LGIIALTLTQCLLCIKIKKLIGQNAVEKTKSSILKLILSATLVSFITLLPFAAGKILGVISLILLTPYLMLIVFQGYQENLFFLTAIPQTFALLKGSWGNMLWNSCKIFILLIFAYILINTPFAYSYIESIYINFNAEPDTINLIRMFVFTFLITLLFSVYFVFQIATSLLSFYAFKEIVYAENLHKRIEMFGEKKVMFGFEKEI
jgi:hypothetical protein